MPARVIFERADHAIGDVITIDGGVRCRVVSKINSMRGYRYGLKILEALS